MVVTALLKYAAARCRMDPAKGGKRRVPAAAFTRSGTLLPLHHPGLFSANRTKGGGEKGGEGTAARRGPVASSIRASFFMHPDLGNGGKRGGKKRGKKKKGTNHTVHVYVANDSDGTRLRTPNLSGPT